MRCFRCQGLMVTITLRDIGFSPDAYMSWQCLLCGAVIDPAIQANRRGRRDPTRNKARPPGSPLVGADKRKKSFR